MSFVFRLERVLSVRCLQEDSAQQRHAEALECRSRAEGILCGLSGQLEQTLEQLDELKHNDELTPEALYLHSLHVSGLRRSIQTARSEFERRAAEAEKTAAELVEAHRAREALEKLREREHETWRRDIAQREAKQMDDLAATRRRAREEENHGP